MRIKITNIGDKLFYDKTDCTDDVANILIDNFDEVYLSNLSLTFNYGDANVSIAATTDGVSCLVDDGRINPFSMGDMVTIIISNGRVSIWCEYQCKYIMQMDISHEEDD